MDFYTQDWVFTKNGGGAMEAEYSLLLELVRSQMTGATPALPENPNWELLGLMARRHKLEPFLYMALQGIDLPRALSDRLYTAYHKALFRDTQFDHIRMQVTQALQKHNIPHIFMRGICLKQHYPLPWLRTMADIDILIHDRDLPAIRKAMAETDGQAVYGDGNHRNYKFPEGVSLEFHPQLLHPGSPVGTAVNPGWQYVPHQINACQQMSEEGFYLNIMCHFANHFFAGGAGIRFVLDIWVCNHVRKAEMDRSFVEQELEKAGLLEFAKKIEQLSEIWFSGAPMAPELEPLAQYICTSGLHGREDRAQLNAVSFSKGGTGFSALMGKVFYPRGDLENRFDWVRGRWYLIPAAWFARVWFAVTQRLPLIKRWHKCTRQFTKEEIQQNKNMLMDFGLKSVGG